MLAVGAPQRLATQQIAAVGIAQGQGFAMGAVAGQKPALKVDTPHRIGIATRRERGTRRWRAPAQPAPDGQPLAVEQLANRARRRPCHLGLVALEPGAHLDRTPAAMRPPHRQTAFGDRRGDQLRMRVRRPRPFDQPVDPFQPIACQPLVAGLARQPKAPAQRRHRLLPRFRRRHKTHAFIHRTGPQFSHRRDPPRRTVNLLPMSPVYGVTYLPGQDR